MLVLAAGKVQAQAFDDLKAPSMPAGSMIGAQVNEISRPKTLKDLETAVYNNFLDSNNKVLIPNNYGLEFSPWSIGPQKNFDYKSYIEDGGVHLWRNLSLSVASTTSFKVNDSVSSNALGFGARTVILEGKVSDKLKKTYSEQVDNVRNILALQSQLKAGIQLYTGNLAATSTVTLADLESTLINLSPLNSEENTAIIKQVISRLPDNLTPTNVAQAFLDTLKADSLDIQNELATYKSLLDQVKTDRYGFKWEVDAAMALNFPTNNFGYSVVPRYGFWTNFSYRPAVNQNASGKQVKVPSNFEFIAMARWLGYNDDFINQNQPSDTSLFETGDVLDFGLRAVYEYKKFSAELEYIYRINRNQESVFVNDIRYSRTVNDDTYKFIINLNYNISSNLVLSYNIGKNYDLMNGQKGNLVSGFSLNAGFGGIKKPVKAD